jgi:hypothetical protein
MLLSPGKLRPKREEDAMRLNYLAEAREIEPRSDEVMGIHVRRLAYAETLPH